MSKTFKPTSGLIFTYGGEMGEFVNLQWSGLEVFATVPLKSLLEFANSIERRETLPDKSDIVLRQQSDAWSAVWDLCVNLGMLDMKSAVAQSGHERAIAFIVQLAISAKQAEAPLSGRTKLLAMMAATIRAGYLAAGHNGNSERCAGEASDQLDAVEKGAK